jgi:hypothetical protein
LFDFLFKLIDANSMFFSVWTWSITIDVSSVKSRLTLAFSTWLISCRMMTCSVVAILSSSNKIFCAFFSASSTDKMSVRILIESCFFLSTSWRSFSVFLCRIRNPSSSFWLGVDRSIVSVSLWNVLSDETSSMLFSICWSSWL